MWRTGKGTRTIQGAEWALFREALSGLWDRVEEAGDDWDEPGLEVDMFDELQRNQKLAMLAFVGEALSNKKVKPPALTAVGEATIAAVFAFLLEEVAVAIDLENSPISPSDGSDAIDWTAERKHILAAYREAKLNDHDGDHEGEGADEALDATSDDLDFWKSMIEDLEDRILWEDGDYQMGREFLDLGPEQRAAMLAYANIDEAYYLAIAPDPTDSQLEEIRRKLAALTGRVEPT